MGEKIGKEKLQTAIKNSPLIYEQVSNLDAIKFTQFKNNSIYSIIGSWGDSGGRAGSVDKITFDEYEKQNSNIESIFEEMLSHSALQKITRISTPFFPDGGIDAKFKSGSQYEWFVTCPSCKKEQQMLFPDNIINYFESEYIKVDSEEYFEKINEVYIGCKYCKAYIDRTSDFYIKTSKWKANRPHLIGIKNSYRVTYFMLPWKTGKEILYKYHSFKYIHQFYNEVLGYAYKSQEASLNESIFLQCQKPTLINVFKEIKNLRCVSVGIDWGMVSWVVVRARGITPDTKKPHIVYIERIDKESLKRNGYSGEQTDHVSRVIQICEFFGADIIINDANGIGVDRNSYLARHFGDKSYGAFYDTGEMTRQKRKSHVIEPQWSKNKVTVSRVGSIKLLIQEYMKLDVSIPRIDDTVQEFIQHHLNVGIETLVDEDTGIDYQVVGESGESHLLHSDNYSKIGFDEISKESKFPIGSML